MLSLTKFVTFYFAKIYRQTNLINAMLYYAIDDALTF